MFFSKNLIDQLEAGTTLDVTKEGEAVDRDLRIATVLVLIQLGHIDDEFDSEELRALVVNVGKAFILDDVEVGELLELTNIIRKKEGVLSSAVELINQSFSPAQKEEILSVVWKVIMADGVADSVEARYAALVRERFGLGLDAAIRARQKAETDIAKDPVPVEDDCDCDDEPVE